MDLIVRRKRMLCVIFAMIVVVAALRRRARMRRNRVKAPYVNRDPHRERYLLSIIESTDEKCKDMTRMSRASFFHLSNILKSRGLVSNTAWSTVEEQLVMFLHTVGHSVRNRVVKHNFIRSGETVSRYFNVVLKAIGSLKDEYIIPPSSVTPIEIISKKRYWPWFKDCVGAIDGTHVRASNLPIELKGSFWGRKEYPTQNVLATVNFDLTFSYVLAGWEGSAHDAKVLKSALERENGLAIPEGKYYLADAGYTTKYGFIAPYQNVRYHLNEFGNENPPTNMKELFNLRHSSLRSTVERAFSLLKGRFGLLDTKTRYPFKTQVDLVLVCCILHNFIAHNDPEDDMFREARVDVSAQSVDNPRPPQFRTRALERENNLEWCAMRDTIAQDMWLARSSSY